MQAGTWRAPDIGVPTVSVVVSPSGLTAKTAAGHPGVYSGVCVDVSSVKDDGVLLGTPEVESGVNVVPAGSCRKVQFAQMSVSVTALVIPDGSERRSSGGVLSLSFPWSVNPIGADSFFVHGEHRFDSGVSLNIDGIAREGAAGETVVSSGVECRLDGTVGDNLCGEVNVAWRKCPRWDLCAPLQREAELGARIRPSPVAVQVWRGAGCVRREFTMEATVARWTDLHTIARPKNAMDAAVRRKEQV